ncbi:succinate dehydrogenase subunit D [Tahibacter aquaticus]|uniref:Succinate dehydrogenase hydrophobic membrane anchor subunit n=1 Tax=Tahibacter aquaticus TaxID=520092 RepID=A0A4R6YK13_9GAMM|nr:succinate dehydrogenase, hydrophobic membrane anchor protein [Tahibacter aquaticus]TDR37358.1 succinate dehydrogenase subunit D [Tahibacter aquaticus]
MSRPNLQTPLKQVRGLGSARGGTHHFIVQRITAIALVPLSLWLVWLLLSLVHLDYAGARALLATPCHAVLMAAFVLAAFWHAQLGLQVVIEDYVHTPGLEIALQIAVKFLCVLGALACTLAIVRIALGS